jgi:ElaB/YqjD/DUF883 family membrane-anchored ribosome-binding protein
MNELPNTVESGVNKPREAFGDRVTRMAGRAVEATRSGTNHALDSAADQVDKLRNQATPAVDKAAEHALALTERSIALLRESSRMLRDKAQHARDSTVSYVSHEPMKALLFAAAAGAAVALLFGSRGMRH